jgi:hypothetical protein
VSRRPNRTHAVVVDGDSVTFPTVGPENLVQLAEESLRVYSTLLRMLPSYGNVVEDREYISSISGLISRDVTSPTRLSSAEVAVLTEMSYQVLSLRYTFPSLRPLVDRLHGTCWVTKFFTRAAYASDFVPTPSSLNHGSSRTWNSLIIPELYAPFGFTDIWKGNHHGEPVCIKALRPQDPIRLREIEMVC